MVRTILSRYPEISSHTDTVLLIKFYNLLFYVATPFVLLRLLWRSRREPDYLADLPERFGYVDYQRAGAIWVHAVSAGETNAAAPLIERLLAAGHSVIVTHMTPTGRERARILFGDRVKRAYAPYDLPRAMTRFLARVRPSALVIIDTEMWPNMLRYTKASGAVTSLVNARLSESSARGYARIGSITGPMLASLDIVATQTASHGERFVKLGLPIERLHVAGSIKFDASLPDDLAGKASAIRAKMGTRRVFLAASTHPGEEEIILDATAGVDVLLVLAPRHPHRADAVEAICQERGLRLVRHSDGSPCDSRTQVLLLDTMGELLYFYEAADVAFVGGSLVDVGGHNPMEPAALNVPFFMGPYLRNIEDIAAMFVEASGMRVVTSGEEVRAALSLLLEDRVARDRQVEAADAVMAANRGALDRVVKLVLKDL